MVVQQRVPPDLELKVRLEQRSAERHLIFEANAWHASWRMTHRTYEPQVLVRDPQDYFISLFGDIDHTGPLSPIKDHFSGEKIAIQGRALFRELFPKALREDLWRIRHELKSLQIISEEPWIPWEVCQMEGEDAGRHRDGPFLGEYRLARWLPGHTAQVRLPLKRVLLTSLKDGIDAGPEIRQLKEMFGEDRAHEMPATWPSLKRAMSDGDFDGWHLAGHASRGPGGVAQLALDDATPLSQDMLSGEQRNMGRAHPLVFFNCCHSARSAFALTRIGGWAHRLIELGAGAFIGAMWSVKDDTARMFAECFYQGFMDGKSLGEAVVKARLKVREEFSTLPDWLAFSVFGDPLARMKDPVAESTTMKRRIDGIQELIEARAPRMQEWFEHYGLDPQSLTTILGSDGNFMMASYLIEDIASGYFAHRPPDQLPTQLEDYFEDRFQALKRSPEGEVAALVYVILAAVKEPVTVEMLAVFAAQEPREIHSLLERWPIIIRRDDDFVDGPRFQIRDQAFMTWLKTQSHWRVAHQQIASSLRRVLMNRTAT